MDVIIRCLKVQSSLTKTIGAFHLSHNRHLHCVSTGPMSRYAAINKGFSSCNRRRVTVELGKGCQDRRRHIGRSHGSRLRDETRTESSLDEIAPKMANQHALTRTKFAFLRKEGVLPGRLGE